MLENIKIAVAQPTLAKLAYRDITTPGAGGWGTTTPSVPGDYPIEDSVGWKIELEHHEIGAFGPINRNLALYANLFLQPNEINISEYPALALTKYPDGVYIVKYNPFDDQGDPLLAQPHQMVILVVAQLRIEETKLLIKYAKTPYQNTKEMIQEKLNEFRTLLQVCKSHVLTDSYTEAVETFKLLEKTINEAKSLL